MFLIVLCLYKRFVVFVLLLPDLQLFYILWELSIKSCFLSLLRSPKSCIWVDILPAKQLFHDSHCCKGLIHSIRNCISPSSTYISKSAGWRLCDSGFYHQTRLNHHVHRNIWDSDPKHTSRILKDSWQRGVTESYQLTDLNPTEKVLVRVKCKSKEKATNKCKICSLCEWQIHGCASCFGLISLPALAEWKLCWALFSVPILK